MVGMLVARRMSGGRSSARAAFRAASTGSIPEKGGVSSNSWYAIMEKEYTSTCAGDVALRRQRHARAFPDLARAFQ